MSQRTSRPTAAGATLLWMTVLAFAGFAEAGTTRLVINLREFRADTAAPGDNQSDAQGFTQPGFLDGAARAHSDPTPQDDASGDEVTAALRQRSTIDDVGIDLTGEFDFDIGPDATPQEIGPITNVFSSVRAIWEVAGGDTRMLMDMSVTAVGEPRVFLFGLENIDTNDLVVDVSGDQSVDVILGPGRYRIFWDFGESSDDPGFDQDGAHSLSVRFVDPDTGQPNPIPLPPAAWAGLVTLAGCAAVGAVRRHYRHSHRAP